MSPKGKKPKRPRAARRARERELRTDVRAREKLAAALPGGAPSRPIDVTTTAVIETRALALGCHQCDGALALTDHAADPTTGLRRVTVTCRRCHTPRTLWFRLPQLN